MAEKGYNLNVVSSFTKCKNNSPAKAGQKESAMTIGKTSFIVVFFAVLSLATSASAQTNEPTTFGIQVSFGPQWQIMPQVGNLFRSDIDLTGREVRVGMVRGRTLGGDWGVSYTHNKVSDTSFIQTSSGRCGGYPTEYYQCFDIGTTYRLRGVSFDGLEVHKYVPFVTIQRRVQVGMNIAGGIGRVKGSAEKRVTTVQEVNEMPLRKYYVPVETVSNALAADVLKEEGGPSIIPMVRAEAVVVIIVARGLKVKVSTGGVGVLGYSRFNIGATYLF